MRRRDFLKGSIGLGARLAGLKAVLPKARPKVVKLKPRQLRVWPPGDCMVCVALADIEKDEYGWFWVGGSLEPIIDRRTPCS